MLNGIIEIDVHGKNVESAIEEIRKQLNNAKPGVYRIRIIHGFHGGTRKMEGGDITARVGDTITLPDCTKEGYEFTGWYDGDTCI